ncbi:hypothetical protein D0Z00_003432 [Geotrichum galactomycetum]|uniref:Uncharacterized protein n=1 Tax=Geotrichum galactomycetum TaxID=27317 RepID=A0ACB6V1A4_9ASCO|nr:hypothetical protein D0Z00_003432 [Geotrichum candidum]
MVSVLLRQVKFLDLHKLSQLSTILFSLIFVFNYYKYSWTQTRPFHKEYDNCQTLLQRGQWSANYTASTPQIWQPQNCVMHNYTLEDVKKCSPEPSRIIFWGDSTARQIFWKMLQIMDPSTVPDGNQHGNMRFTRHGVAVTMFFDPYLNKTEGGIDQIINLSQNETEAGHTTILYITTGLWHSLFNPREGVVDSYKRTVDNVTAILRNQIIGAFGAVYFNPTQIPQYELLDASRKGKIDAKYLDPMRDYSDSVFNYDRENARNGGEPGAFEGVIFTHDNRPAAYYTPVFDQIGPGHLSLYDGIGLHYRDAAVEVQAQTLLNHYARPLVTVNTFLPLLVIPAIVGIVMLINAKTSVLKAVANVVLTSVVAGIYSFLCDRTHMINKATMYPQWAQFAALTQIWVVVTVLFVGRVRNDPQQPGAGSVTTLTSFFSSTELLNEFKGVLISVWLIITVSGMKTMPTGAHLAEILQVVLLFVAVYHATLVGAQSTKRTLVDLARALLPTSLLALLLDMEFSFYQMAAKMVLWTTFVALVNVRRVGLIPSLGMVSALAGLYYIGASAFSSGSDRVFYIITFDYAIGVLAVLAGTVVAHHQQKAIRAATAKVGNSTSSSNSDQGTLVKLVVNSIPFKLVIVAVSFVFIYTVSIPLLNHEHDIVSTHHTKWPALSLIVVYVGLRLMLRTGHGALGSYFKRVGISERNHNCECGQPETVDHCF